MCLFSSIHTLASAILIECLPLFLPVFSTSLSFFSFLEIAFGAFISLVTKYYAGSIQEKQLLSLTVLSVIKSPLPVLISYILQQALVS